jgi:hypothetical protein
MLPADAGATDMSELARTPIATAAKNFFFIFFPCLRAPSEPLCLFDARGVGLVPSKGDFFEDY